MGKQEKSKSLGNGGASHDRSPMKENDVRRSQPPRDTIVFACMTIVAAALAAMLYGQMGMSLSMSAVAAAGAWALFLLIHKFVQKSQQIVQLQAELEHAKGRGSARANASAGLALSAPPKEAAPKAKTEVTAKEPPAGARSALAPSPTPGPSETKFARPRWDQISERTEKSEPKLSPTVAEAPRSEGPAIEPPPPPTISMPEGPVWPGVAVPPAGEAIREQWAFRPRGDRAPILPVGTGNLPSAASAPTVEGELDRVQSKIKALADEVNFGALLQVTPKPSEAEYAKATAEAIEDSIGALKAAASNMRRGPDSADQSARGLGEIVIPSTAKPIAMSETHSSFAESPAPIFDLPFPDLSSIGFAPPTSTAIPPLSYRDAVRGAIEANAIEMFLSPIVALQANDVGHYDVSMHLSDASGNQLTVSDEMLGEMDAELAAKLDIERLDRAAQLVARMEARSKNGYLVTKVLGASLSSRSFLDSLSRLCQLRPRLSQQLVLALSQDAIDALSADASQALQDIQSIGFQFALDGMTHVGTDFAELAACGFTFVRVDAVSLIHGLETAERIVAPDELCQRIALAGLTVIATGVDTAQTQAALAVSGIALGEGSLFGPPRPIKVDQENGRSAAA